MEDKEEQTRLTAAPVGIPGVHGHVNDPKVITAVNKAWNNDFGGASAELEETRKRIPRHALHYAEASWIRSLLVNSHEDTNKVRRRSLSLSQSETLLLFSSASRCSKKRPS